MVYQLEITNIHKNMTMKSRNLSFVEDIFPYRSSRNSNSNEKNQKLLLRIVRSGRMNKKLRSLDIVNVLGQKIHLVLTL